MRVYRESACQTLCSSRCFVSPAYRILRWANAEHRGIRFVGATHAVLIGIETYQKQGISSVQFAQADAAAMKDVLVQDLGVPAENITVWIDSEAT